MAEPAAVRKAYREVLRAVGRHVSPVAGNLGIRDYVRAQFRRRDWGGPEREQKAVEAGREWADLVTSIHAHKALLHSYNIDVDREAELRERLENTAQRVGLRLTPDGPSPYQ